MTASVERRLSTIYISLPVRHFVIKPKSHYNIKKNLYFSNNFILFYFILLIFNGSFYFREVTQPTNRETIAVAYSKLANQKIHAFYGTLRFITLLQEPASVDSFTPHFSGISLHIILQLRLSQMVSSLQSCLHFCLPRTWCYRV
jgi:hypothetical protein